MAREGEVFQEGKSGAKREGMGQGGGERENGMVCCRDGFLMPAKQKNINKIKISGRKLAHGTHIHAGNGIFWAWRGRNKGRGRMRMGMVVSPRTQYWHSVCILEGVGWQSLF